MRFYKLFIPAMILLVFSGIVSAANTTYDLKIDVKHFQLENGMLFLVVERPAAPQVAVRLAIRAGSALEETGKTGIAHLLEHMMFKGTKNFGSLNYEKDEQLQARIEAAYQIVLEEQNKRDPDTALIAKKRAEMNELRLEVQKIYVPQVFSSQLGKNGAVGVNAFTSKDQTQYLASVPSDMLEQWFSIISEQLFEPAWREFYVEKEVVQREWAFRYINDPNGAAWLDLSTAAYTAHPYRNPTIGWKSDMEKYSAQDAIEFHETFYNPSNAVCVLVGDTTLEKVRRLAEIYFKRYPAGRRSPEKVTREPIQQGPRRSIRYLKGARTPLVRIGFHGAAIDTKDFYALDAMTMILSHGRSARMTQNIIDKGLAQVAWSYNPDNRYGGMVILGGSPNEPDIVKKEGVGDEEKRRAYLRACQQLEDILLAEAEKMKTELVSDRELQRIKKLNQRGFIDRMRSNESLAGTLATLEVQVGWRYMMNYLEKIDSITPEDIRQAANKYIQIDNKTSVYVIPGGRPDHPRESYSEVRSITGSRAAKIDRPHDSNNISIYPTLAGWKHPLSFQRHPQKIDYPAAHSLDVGRTRIFYLPDRELPLVDLTLLVKAGSVDITDSKIGLADLLNGSLIRGGTENYPPAELARVLDENAIHISVQVGEEETVINLSVLKEDWQLGLTLLQEILTRPGLEPRVLEVVKSQMLTALKRQGGDARAVAGREREIWHFKGHPYGRDPLAGLKTIPAISGEDLKRFLREYFVPSNLVAAVSGDIDQEEVIAGLEQFFKALPQTSAPQRKLTDPKETPPLLALIHKPGQVQSQIALSLPSVKRTHPDYWKINLLMDIFGGSDSLMYTRLRDDLGLVYAAGFYETYKWEAGMLFGYIGCKGDKTVPAITETLNIMTSLRQDVPRKELEQKRLDALNSFVFNVDTPADLVKTYARYYMRNESLDTLGKIQDAFFNADRKILRRLAEDYLNPLKIQIFVVGDRLIKVKNDHGDQVTLEQALMELAESLGLPYRELALR
ncbi:MAG: insulinase family protein [Deltaproteobacteria bacterium]|jgi:predicted Zn-dependent peptidase|nr:insulinase family protein [Deltaproteobacteria bacterium]